MADYSFTYATGGAPTPAQAQYWEQEFRLFQHQPPDPSARSEARQRGWGFDPWLLPPEDCYDFVVANLKRQLRVEATDRFRPEAKYSIFCTLTAYFSWLRTQEGTRWLLALYGIDIVAPHPGYAYFYQNERLIEPRFGLRIYQVDRSARTLKVPHEYAGMGLLGRLKDILVSRRGPSNTPLPEPRDRMWCSVGGCLRDWLIEKDADRNWPTHKPDRISGYVWARGLLWPGSQTDYVWTVIGKAEDYTDDNRLYRIQSPAFEERLVGGVMKRIAASNPGVIWTDRKQMHVVPLTDVDKHQGADATTIEAKYRCRSCDQIRCCTMSKGRAGNDRLCMNCHGTQLESGERSSFDFCQRRECRNCPEYLRSDEERINLVSRLNLSSDRVRRA